MAKTRLLDQKGGVLMMTHAIGTSSRTTLMMGLALFFLVGSAATAEDVPQVCGDKPYVVKIHADWCASCKALESVWQRIETDLGDRATTVTLDVSDRVAYMESQATAEHLGIQEFFQEYRSRTGTIAVLDCNTHEPVAIMSAERDFEKYREAVARAGSPS
jgi:thiol-disulfide isomerase/thioredoxin